jgi:hypothetical protein
LLQRCRLIPQILRKGVWAAPRIRTLPALISEKSATTPSTPSILVRTSNRYRRTLPVSLISQIQSPADTVKDRFSDKKAGRERPACFSASSDQRDASFMISA